MRRQQRVSQSVIYNIATEAKRESLDSQELILQRSVDAVRDAPDERVDCFAWNSIFKQRMNSRKDGTGLLVPVIDAQAGDV